MDRAEYVFYKLAQLKKVEQNSWWGDGSSFDLGNNTYVDMSKASDENKRKYNFRFGANFIKDEADMVKRSPILMKDPYNLDTTYSSSYLWNLSDVPVDQFLGYGEMRKKLGLGRGSKVDINSDEYKALERYMEGLPQIRSVGKDGKIYFHANNINNNQKNNNFKNYSMENYA